MDDSIMHNSRSAINSDNALNNSSIIIDNEGSSNSSPTGGVISRSGGHGSGVPKTNWRNSGIDSSNDSGGPPDTGVTSSFSSHTSAGKSGSYCDGSGASPCFSVDTCHSSSTMRRNSRICRSSNNKRSRVVPDTDSGAGEDAPCTFYYVTKGQGKAAPASGRHTSSKKKASSRAPGRHRASSATATATWVCSVAGCGARFRKKAHAKRHGAVHTAERPYSCACCSASFKRSEHLRRHCYIVHHNAQAFLTGSRSSVIGTCIAKSETSLDNDGGVGAAALKERSVGDQLELADKICFASGASGVKSSARDNTAVETGNRREVEAKKAGVGRPANGSHPAGLALRVSPEVELLQHASDSHSQHRRSPAGKRKSTEAKEIAGALAVDTSVPVNRGVRVGGDSICSLPACADVGAVCSTSVSGSRDTRVAAASNVFDVSAAAVVAAPRCCGTSPAKLCAASVEAVPGAIAALAYPPAAASTGQHGMEPTEEVASAEIAMVADSDVRPSSPQQGAAATPVDPSIAAVRRPFACEKCGKTFVLKQHLTRHAKCHIGRYACKECDAAFAKKQQLRLHLLEHLVSRIEEERIEEERAVDRSVDKERCGIDEIEETPCHGEDPVDRHSEYEEELRRTSSNVQGCSGDPISERKTFLCPHKGCGAIFTSLDRLYIHLKRVSTRARDYECETCGQAFLRFSALVAHRRAAHPANVHVCTVCSKRFSRVTRLREHIRIRHGENKNDTDEDSQRATADGASCLCPVPSCGLAFATVSNMRAHYRVKHMQLREFKCETCGAAFGFKAVLRRHVARVHGGNLETGAAAFSEARIEVADGSQSADVDARAAASTGSEGKPRPDHVIEGSAVHPRSGVHAIVSCTHGSRSSVSTGDHLPVDGNSLTKEERLAPREHPTQIKTACCSGFFVAKTVHQREEQTLRHRGHSPHHDETKHTNVSSCSGVCSGGMRGQSSAATEEDFPAGQTKKEDIHLPTSYSSLTDGEWIVDAVRLNLLPVTVEGQL